MPRPACIILACLCVLSSCVRKTSDNLLQRISRCDLSYTVIHPDTIPNDDFFPGAAPEEYWDDQWHTRPAPLGYRGADYQRFDICFSSVRKTGPLTYSVNGWTWCQRVDLPFSGWIQLDSVKEYGAYWSDVERDEPSPENPVACYRLYAHYHFDAGLNDTVTAEMLGTAWYDIAEYKGIIYYDGTGMVSDGYCNNQYEGVWVDKTTRDTLVCNWGDFRIPDSKDLDIGAGEFSVAPEWRQNGWEYDDYPYRYGYSLSHKDTLWTVLEEPVTQAEWEEAYAHRAEYNYYRDTTDVKRNKQVRKATERILSTSGWQSYFVWGDVVFGNIGHFKETDEDIVDLWHENDMEAVFVSHNKADSCIIAGSDYGVYGKNRIYAGCSGFDCDNFVWLFFYRTSDKPYHHTVFLCEYKKGASFERGFASDEEEIEWYGKNPMVWYKDYLYYRAWTYVPVYYRLRLVRK